MNGGRANNERRGAVASGGGTNDDDISTTSNDGHGAPADEGSVAAVEDSGGAPLSRWTS